jgi:hypothetical protein
MNRKIATLMPGMSMVTATPTYDPNESTMTHDGVVVTIESVPEELPPFEPRLNRKGRRAAASRRRRAKR